MNYQLNHILAIELSCRSHPGKVVEIGECPIVETLLLIGFETGTCILWNLKNKTPDQRFHCPSNLTSQVWHYDGKQVCKLPIRASLTIMLSS